MKKQPTLETPHDWGGLFGRTHHPADPAGSVFGKTHWPKSAPHEKGDLTGRTAGFVVREDKPTPKATKVVKSETGLVSLKDFLDEAKLLGVLDKVLKGKLEAVWGKTLPNPGMYRMQSNNLLRNAIKRKETGGTA